MKPENKKYIFSLEPSCLYDIEIHTRFKMDQKIAIDIKNKIDGVTNAFIEKNGYLCRVDIGKLFGKEEVKADIAKYLDKLLNQL